MSQPTHHDRIEVIIDDDPWAQYGSALPNAISPALSETIQSSTAFSSRSRWPVWSAATLFTVMVHSLIFGPLLLGTPGRKYKPPMSEGASASAQTGAQGEFVSTLIFINDHSITTPEVQDDSAYVVAQQNELNTKTNPDFAILSSTPQLEISGSEEGTDPNSQSIEAVGDAAGRAMMFGRYMGQIKARVERAWGYPTNTSITSFKCTVQIKQTQSGDVQEVTLQRCDNDGAWQLSLAKAIQAASPLPAPPDERVFSNVVTLGFDVHSTASN